MIDVIAPAVVFLVGLYLVALAAALLMDPTRAARFLLGFAGSSSAHYLELACRLIAGGAFVVQAPRLPWSVGFAAFGWVLLLTTAALFAVPWRVHRQFAQRAVPRALRHPRLLGIASLALGCLVLLAAACGASGSSSGR